MTEDKAFLRDRDVAHMIGMSPSWIRVQRHYRRRDQAHVLDIDPVMIGSKPVYALEDVSSWVERIRGAERQPKPR